MSTPYKITDVGRTRDTNEDMVLVDSIGEEHLLVVADGMGGHAAGDVASELAAETVREVVTEMLDEDCLVLPPTDAYLRRFPWKIPSG